MSSLEKVPFTRITGAATYDGDTPGLKFAIEVMIGNTVSRTNDTVEVEHADVDPAVFERFA